MKRMKRSIYIVCGCAFLVLVAIEGGVRLWQSSATQEENVYGDLSTIVPHPYLVHASKPNIQTARLHTNAMGFRGPDFDQQKATGTFRVVVLGGSHVFGWGASNDEATIPAVLERVLRERYPQRNIEVINAGRRWYNSTQALILYETVLTHLSPDALVFMGGYTGLVHGVASNVPAGEAVLWYDLNMRSALQAIIQSDLTWEDIQRPLVKILGMSAAIRQVFDVYESEVTSWRIRTDPTYSQEDHARRDLADVFLRNARYLMAAAAADGVPILVGLQPIILDRGHHPPGEELLVGAPAPDGVIEEVQRNMDEIREGLPGQLTPGATFVDLRQSLGGDAILFRKSGGLTDAAYAQIAQSFAEGLRPLLE